MERGLPEDAYACCSGLRDFLAVGTAHSVDLGMPPNYRYVAPLQALVGWLQTGKVYQEPVITTSGMEV